MQRSNKGKSFENILFDNKEIKALVDNNKFGEAADLLLINQKEDWRLLNSGYEALKHLKIREVSFSGFNITLQFNPNRIASSSAQVDPGSIKERPCFLCYSGLPPEQKGILYEGDYLILCNPYPIFPEHFTIPNINHFPQAIKRSFKTLLNLSRDLSLYYSVIYNGPQCGASAPDHLHFQAVTKMFLPVEKNFYELKTMYGEEIVKSNSYEIFGLDDGLRRFISVESKSHHTTLKIFNRLYNILEKISTGNEPPINIIAGYSEEYGWRILFFLRSKHRSSHYYKEAGQNILLSPGAVDMGGICILPLEKDFIKLDKTTLKEIFNEVSIGKEYFDYVKSSLKKKVLSLSNFGS